MNSLLAVVIISVVIVCYVYGMKELSEAEARAIEREKEFQKWLFDSLYSINHKVVLPEVHERKVINRPAKVYSPTEDPMSEFNGQKDDL